MSESTIRTDVLPDELTEERTRIKVSAESHFVNIIANIPERTGSILPAKNINETKELILQSIRDYEERTEVIKDKQIKLLLKEPDLPAEFESISICLEQRLPGVFGQLNPSAAMSSNKPRNMKPILREVEDDPDAPGYKRAILGYFYDNTISLTCWARTAKTADDRALWLEKVMQEYVWYYQLAGINNIYFIGRDKDITKDIENNKIYGRKLLFYVRTESIQALRQKTLEQIYVKLALTS